MLFPLLGMPFFPSMPGELTLFPEDLSLSPPPGSLQNLPEVPAPSSLTSASHLYLRLVEACDFWGAQEREVL